MATMKKAAAGVFWGTVERAANQCVSFVVLLILARILGPEKYGIVALAATIALFGQMLLGETFAQALIQQKTLDDRHVSSLLIVLTCAGAAFCLAQILAADGLARIFAMPDSAPVLRALGVLPFLAALQSVPSALFRRDLDFRSIAASTTGGNLLGGVTGIALALAGYGIWSLVASLIVQNVVTAVSLWLRSAARPALRFSFPHFKELWWFGRHSLLLRVAAYLANQSPRILVGYLFDAAALGAFSLGLRLIELLYQLLTVPMVNVVVPVVARLREDKARLERVILSATQLSAMIAAPVFAGLALIAPFALPLVFGEKWRASIEIVQILSVYGIVVSCGLVWQGIVSALGRPDISLATAGIAALVNVTLIVATSGFGLVAAAAAFVVRGYVTLPFMPRIIARLTGIPAARQYRVYAPVLAATAIMAVAVESLILAGGGRWSDAEMVAAAVAMGALVYGGALFAFARPALRQGFTLLAQLRPSVGAA